MRTRSAALLSAVTAAIAACSTTAATDALVTAGQDATPAADAGFAVDASQLAIDASQPAPDATQRDAEPPDGGFLDAMEPRDAVARDAAEPDASAPDATAPDASAQDAQPVRDAGAGPCMDDRDCPGGFCRQTMAGGMECHAFSAEGERCGGFRPPWSVERCEPTFICLDDDPRLADAPGTCLLEATVARLLAAPRAFDGRRVGIVTAEVVAGTAGCTRLRCDPAMPCCNTCNSEEKLADSPPGAALIAFSGPGAMRYTCRGSNCDWQDMCTLRTGRYRVIGVYRATPSPHLEIETIRPYP